MCENIGALRPHELWRVILPPEDPTVFNPAVGSFGFNQFVSTRARITADGQIAYVITWTATGDNNTSRSFVYSLSASNSTPPPPTATSLRSTSITLSANLPRRHTLAATGLVAVKNQNGAAVAGATVATTWNLPNGTMQNQTVSTSTKG